MKTILGIDIGTTSVCALLCDIESGETLFSKTLENSSFVNSPHSFEKAQDPLAIVNTVKKALEGFETSGLSAIGITGQMHGILYLDSKNCPVSPLYTWQDERGNLLFKDGKTYAEYLTEKTGIKAATGFGLTTHFYNLKNGLVPKNAVRLSTIHDYLASLITATAPVTHSSDAASLGFFDLKSCEFDEAALKSVGIDCSFLPKVIKNAEVVGKTSCDFLPKGVPVCVAIGDNQASFLGSVKNKGDSVLVNVGTGSQVSFVTKSLVSPESGEIRPLTNGEYIFVGSSLCGGRAYKILKSFFALSAEMTGGSSENLYEKMDALSKDYKALENPLKVNCEFCGTRKDPKKRGFIENISENNFTPQNLICGVLKGVAEELFRMYNEALPLLKNKPLYLVGSGNGLRKSRVWQEIFKEMFSLDMKIPRYSEEASRGAIAFAAYGAGIFASLEEAQAILIKEE